MSKNYFIFIGGQKIPVDEETYRAFMRPVWAEKQRKKTRKDKEFPLDVFLEGGFEPVSNERLVEDIVEDNILLEMLCDALRELTDDERDLIDALFYQEKSERTLAREMGIRQSTLSHRKHKILAKLKKFFEKS